MILNKQLDELSVLSRRYHKDAKKIVLATGVFDYLHKEHVKFLELARKQGDVLFVGVETDDRVKQLKGEGRPLQSLEVRLNNLKKVAIVDEVFILPNNLINVEVQKQLMAAVRPSVYAVSSHSPFLNKKKKAVEQFGGKLIVVHQHNDQISTTKLIKEMNEKNV